MHNDELREVVRDAIRQELAPIEGRVTALEGLVQQLSGAVTTCANAAAKALEVALDAKRASEDTRDAAAKMITSAIDQQKQAIASTVGEIVKPISEDMRDLRRNDESQNLAMVLFARQLGVEGNLDPALRQNSLPPASGDPKPPTHPVLPTIDRRSRIITIVVSVALVAQAVREVIAIFFPNHH